MKKPMIGITMGDPAGVGPEICLHALNNSNVFQHCVPVVFGDASVLKQCAESLSLPLPQEGITDDDLSKLAQQERPCLVNVPSLAADSFQTGKVSADTGRASYAYINRAIDAALDHSLAAVTTAPINKEALNKAGVPFPGHTEIFAHRAGSDRWCMMQYSEEITCTFVTVHVGYHEVPQLLTIPRILEVIELSAENLERIRGRKAKVVVCGLNPHAGENGAFGSEDVEIVEPAVAELRRAANGAIFSGPHPPDTIFRPAADGQYDAVLACITIRD